MPKQYKNMKSVASDQFQTPGHALDPLLQFLSPAWTIWEPACGRGNLVRYLDQRGFSVFGTDILEDDGRGTDFMKLSETFNYPYDVLITNPPYSIKDQWVARCYQIGKPFALLLPITILASYKRQMMFKKHGVEIVFLPRRINFETPNHAERSKLNKKSCAWYMTCWVTWGLKIGQQLTFTEKT